MIEFRRWTPLERLARLWPPYRKWQDQAVAEAIGRLMDDPSLPCSIEGRVVLDGCGPLTAPYARVPQFTP